MYNWSFSFNLEPSGLAYWIRKKAAILDEDCSKKRRSLSVHQLYNANTSNETDGRLRISSVSYQVALMSITMLA